MPHVELSLTEDTSRHAASSERSRARAASPDPSGDSLARWTAATTGATEPSLVLAVDSTIVAASVSGCALIGLTDPISARGRPLREALGDLIDFTASPAQLDSTEVDKIPPLLAISSGRLARGLMRVVCPGSGKVNTLDAIATPLWDGSTLVGSLTFFSEI